MQKNVSLWQFAGFCLSSLGGTLLHFLYDWTAKSLLVAPFSGVNESTWEHMKLLFFPLFLFAWIQTRYCNAHKSFWCIKFIGITTGLISIPVLFYTYNGAFGKSPDWFNITIFFIATALAFLLEWHLFKQKNMSCKSPRLAFLALCIIGVLFILFTFFPPNIPLFADPLTKTYGI